MRMRCGSKTTTAPASSSSVTAARLVSRSATCCSGRRSVLRRNRTTERAVDTASREEQRREVRVGGDEYATFRGGALEDLLVGRRLETVVADVGRVVAGGRELLGQAVRKRVVDEEPQPAASGSSRSCTASAA